MEQLIVLLFLIFFSLEFLVEFVLNEVNLRYVRACWTENRIPDFYRTQLNPEAYEKSVEYTLAKGQFQRLSEIYSRLSMLAILFSGVLGLLDDLSGRVSAQFGLDAYGHGILFCLAIALFSGLSVCRSIFIQPLVSRPSSASTKPRSKSILAINSRGSFSALLLGVPFLLVVLWLMQAAGRYWWVWRICLYHDVSAFDDRNFSDVYRALVQ